MRAWLIASAVLLTAFAPAPLPRRVKATDDQTRLQGHWHIKTIKWRGNDSYQGSSFGGGMSVNKNDRVVISRGRVTFESSGKPSSGDRTVTFTLSDTGEVRSIDFFGSFQDRPMRGLYKVSGNVLLLSINYTGGARPQSLSGDGDEIAFVLERR
jgi:uncharacterized protein (TIGR03067 family)